ncbi:hypothetical protein PAV_6c04270 [Paenibacillus alvei DSM 29]|nr:hypothetical protein PAV_6c04270 [Paenibacillus alvei DSM 29]
MTLRKRYAAFKLTKTGRVLKFITGIGTILLIILGVWSLSYFINPYLMNWLGWRRDSYWAFLVLCVMGVLFFIMVLAIMFPFMRMKHVKFYQLILDALKKIPKETLTSVSRCMRISEMNTAPSSRGLTKWRIA